MLNYIIEIHMYIIHIYICIQYVYICVYMYTICIDIRTRAYTYMHVCIYIYTCYLRNRFILGRRKITRLFKTFMAVHIFTVVWGVAVFKSAHTE